MSSLRLQKSITTNIPTHYRRLFSFVIDWYVGSILVSLPVSFAYYQIFPLQNTVLDIRVLPFQTAMLTVLTSLFLACMYYVVLPYHWNGQTLGKRICKLRIVEKDKQRISLKTLFIRQCIGIILIEGSIYTITPLILQMICYGNDTILSGITYLHYAISILSVGCCIFTKKRTAIHDLVVNTTVETI